MKEGFNREGHKEHEGERLLALRAKQIFLRVLRALRGSIVPIMKLAVKD
jgi:hypothetical protein